MTTPKVFVLDGINKVFQSDVPIRGKEYVAVYISSNGLSESYMAVPQGSYEIVNDSVVFNSAPLGLYLRLLVGSNRAELLNTPSNIAKVAVNMDAINYVAGNIDAIVDAYTIIATAENIDKITIIGNNIDSVNTVSASIDKVTIVSDNVVNVNPVGINITKVITVADNVGKISIVSTNVDKVTTVADSITNVDSVGTNITKVNTVSDNLSKIITVANDLLEVDSEIDKVANSIINVDKVGNSIDNVNLVANNIESIVNMAKFRVKSDTTLLLSDKTLPKSPVMLSLPDMEGFELQIASNSIKNVSGRDLDITGSMAIQISSTATADIFVYVYSENSMDGTTWTINQGSLRKIKVVKEGIDYITVPSLLLNSKWMNGQYNRFKFYKEGTGDVSLISVSDIVNSTTINGQSFLWTIHEI